MRRMLAAGLIIVLTLAGFYVAWPAWTARQIRNAIEANDPAALERKIDFVSVRARAKPLVAAQMQRTFDDLKQKAGPFGVAIAGQLQESLGGKIADAAIDRFLTPENVVRFVRQGKDLRRVWKDVAGDAGSRRSEKPGNSGEPTRPPVLGSPEPRQPDVANSPRKLTLANVKSYRLVGPLALEVGIARDPAATTPDVIVELAFTGTSWQVVGIVPQL